MDLLELPLTRLDVEPIPARATLRAALRKMDEKQLDALYVVSEHSARVLGVITRQAIEQKLPQPALS